MVGVISGAARGLEGIVEVGWFGQEDQTYLGSLAARWVSVFVVSGSLYGLVLGVGAVGLARARHAVVGWARRFLAFMALLSWFMALQTMMVAEVARGRRGALSLPHEEQVLLICSLLPLLWLVAFGERIKIPSISSIFALSLASLGLALVILEPSVPEAWVVAFGLSRAPMDVVVTGRFLAALPYLAPIGPILWSVYGRRRSTGAPPALRQAREASDRDQR